MESVNNLLNRIDAWGKDFNPETNESQGKFKRVAATRLATVFIGSVLDILAVANETFTVLSVPTKKMIHKFKEISGSDFLDTFEQRLPTTTNITETLYRIAAFAIGAFSSITLGAISPSANFKLHCDLKIAKNTNEETQDISSLLQQTEYDTKAKEVLTQVILNEAAAEVVSSEQHLDTENASNPQIEPQQDGTENTSIISKKNELEAAAVAAATKAEETAEVSVIL